MTTPREAPSASMPACLRPAQDGPQGPSHVRPQPGPEGGAAGGPAKPDPRQPLGSRAGAFEALYCTIAATRMAGVPIVRAGFGVHALGFEPLDGGECGVLVTPWFMNLVFLPPADAPPLAVGVSRGRNVGTHRFDFIGAFEDSFGPYEACSLFSPMFEFEDEAAALATAQAVLAQLRKAPEPPKQATRRALLFGGRA